MQVVEVEQFKVELEEVQEVFVCCVIRCCHKRTPKCPDDLTLERNSGWATWTFGGGVPSTQLLKPRIWVLFWSWSRWRKNVRKDLPSSLISANCLPLRKYE